VYSYRHSVTNMLGPLEQDSSAGGGAEHQNNDGKHANDNDHQGKQTLPEHGIAQRQSGVQAGILLPDGSYHKLEDGVAQVTEEEMQHQLRAKGLQPLPAHRIAELKVFGLVAQ
jgi:hypothetical protein